MYDYLVVGAGLTGAIFAYEAKQHGKKVLVIDKRNHIAGNIYDENINGIKVHKYGPHVFHTNDECVWTYINKFTKFNRFTNTPIANYRGKIYSLPFSMYTFNQIWGVTKPEEARTIIEEQRKEAGITTPQNLEEQAISLVGRDIYEILIKGYTEKQWGRPCKELPAFIINRLPVRFTYDSNYFNALYQGVPVDGYTKIIERMLEGIEVMTDTNFFTNRAEFQSMADTIFFTGQIDEYFDYVLGTLEYRSLRFETEILSDTNNFQGNAIVNYTDHEIPFTRCVEHKHFYPGLNVPGTVITREFSSEWKAGAEPYYPVNNYKNNKLANQYKEFAKTKAPNVIFAGRLGEYFYYDMDAAVIKATEHAFDNFGDII
ncbi:MAG: UDP-galactopyranose mutase [Synergistaceae bacterium]|nr:UDP-galactopyranose mutase [Synergistaceae bacterium]